MFRLATAAAVTSVLVFAGASAGAPPPARSLDGSGNNPFRADWGSAGSQYLRVARPRYADGIARIVAGPPARYVSNRIFNDTGQNLFSENAISQWGWAWGQFLDHDIGLRDETPAEDFSIPFIAGDGLEQFRNDLTTLAFARTPAAPGTGVSSARQQINTLSSFIDASNVYGTTGSRLDWLRTRGGSLLLPGGYLPRADGRGNAAAAPPMNLMGQLAGNPASAVVAGDVRANENLALTSIHTLFAREHNRIVSRLPDWLSGDQKFDLARRVVGAEIEFVTYNEFLPALGVRLDPYGGYDPRTNPTLGNEFAVVGYRAHSMVHGEFEPSFAVQAVPAGDLAYYRGQGITIKDNGDGTLTLVIPLAVAFGNPNLLRRVGEDGALQSLGEREYKNDEQIDNAMRSVLFQVPKPGVPDPSVCGEPVVNPSCFSEIADLGADDIQRGRDHGMPTYNQLRVAYGLRPARSFTEITGEATADFPTNDPLISRTNPSNDPNILDFVALRDDEGRPVPLGDKDNAVVGIRRTTVASRLRAVYRSVDQVEAFAGMVSEPHIAGTEFGPLQLAIWKKQFEALRDGDRFFYRNDPVLQSIRDQFGISYRHTLAELIAANTGFDPPADVFHAVG